MRIAIGSDHAGFDLKQEIIKHLESADHEVLDQGPYSDDRADYPDFAHKVASLIENKEVDIGVLMCGSGNGINMAANKHQGVRSALCWIPEIASLARQHNGANICTMPARFISEEEGKNIVDAFLSAEFEGGRHQARVDKIPINC